MADITKAQALVGAVAKLSNIEFDYASIATNETLAYVGSQVLSSERLTNDFLTNMLNKVGTTLLRQRVFSNPLKTFKKGSNPAGVMIEDLFVNYKAPKDFVDGQNIPFTDSNGETQSYTIANPYEINPPDVKVVYYTQNSRKVFAVTVKESQLVQAFHSWDEMEKLVNMIISSLANNREIWEFKQMKSILGYDFERETSAMTKHGVPSIDDINFPTEFVKICRGLAINMGFPSEEYNNFNEYALATGLDEKGINSNPVTTFTNTDDMSIILRADIGAMIEVDVWATAFNMSNATFLSKKHYVPDFGTCDVDVMGSDEGVHYHLNGKLGDYDTIENGVRYHYSLYAVICDDAFLQIWDNLDKMKSKENELSLYYNYFNHVWQTYALCPFANAVGLYNKVEVPTEV
jgi:hypothetical protein